MSTLRQRVTASARLRGLVAAGVAAGACAASVVAGAAWASGSTNPAQDQYAGKVTICHATHSRKHPHVTLSVSLAAWTHHFSKTVRDTIGACGSETVSTATTTTASTTTTTTSPDGHGNGKGNGRGDGGGNGNGHAHGAGH